MTKTAFLLLATALLMPQMAMAAGDATRGSRLFLQCRACHIVDASAQDGVGPNLNGVVGRKAAARAGYSYSQALLKSGLVWTPANLDAFIKRPSALVPGTKMAFAGVAAQPARDDLVAYLATLKPAR